jgi:single-strand selective monofunctional uracil DNA glycosylase
MPAELIAAAQRLRDAVDQLSFAAPITHVYNPLGYAWRAHQIYLRRHGKGPKRVLFLESAPLAETYSHYIDHLKSKYAG